MRKIALFIALASIVAGASYVGFAKADINTCTTAAWASRQSGTNLIAEAKVTCADGSTNNLQVSIQVQKATVDDGGSTNGPGYCSPSPCPPPVFTNTVNGSRATTASTDDLQLTFACPDIPGTDIAVGKSYEFRTLVTGTGLSQPFTTEPIECVSQSFANQATSAPNGSPPTPDAGTINPFFNCEVTAPEYVQFHGPLGHPVLATAQITNVCRNSWADIGTLGCIQAQRAGGWENEVCATSEDYFISTDAVNLSMTCAYTTFKYDYQAEGYGWVRDLEAHLFTSGWAISNDNDVRCSPSGYGGGH